jgi:5-aminopentanamidase
VDGERQISGVPVRRVALAQFSAVPGDVAQNLGTVLRFVEEAADRGADTVVLPELCVPGYVLDRSAYTPRLLTECAAADHVLLECSATAQVTVVYGTARENSGHLVNTVVLVAPDGTTTGYAKTHMVDEERALFRPGDDVVVLTGSSVALGCCYDLAFPEFSRAAASAGAGVLAFPMAWERERAFVLEAVAAARAVENLAFVVCVNQCGEVGGRRFHGRSRVIDPLGTVRCRLGDEPGMAIADVDLDLVTRLRSRADTASYPLLDDRRTDLRVRVSPGLA